MIKSIVLLLTSTYLANGIPPPHPAVVAVRHAEEQLPFHLRSPALWNRNLQEVLPLTSLLHNGEKAVFEREADTVSRTEIYKILTHAGFIGRRNYINQYPSNKHNHAHYYPPSNDSPFVLNPDLLQYLK
ncbi:uncharacterized protein LOC123696298 [Colias croceus]|uniref:uncharacterized protein LOC123696298 n=1 Tax=Colias crocea TaxID=72248 RepID=UPI001E27A7CB|nr:uncharacterized protein LOC123696298 [Colias croceus]CAG4956007.1 unnamed protein product [Colias eurytheme]